MTCLASKQTFKDSDSITSTLSGFRWDGKENIRFVQLSFMHVLNAALSVSELTVLALKNMF